MTNKKLFWQIFAVVIVFFMIFAGAIICIVLDSSDTSQPTKDNGYYITNYEVVMNINQDNTVNVQERIEVVFTENRHGIVRALPLKSNVQFMHNGQEKSMLYKLNYYDIEATCANGTGVYDTYESNGYLCLQMGSASSFVETYRPVIYDFEYLLDLGDDRLTDMDQFYFNIIGSGWDTTIANFNFKLIFPKSIMDYYSYSGTQQEYGVWLYFNQNNEQKNLKPAIDTTGTILTYSNTEGLDAFSPVTIRVVMEQGYFNNRRSFTYDIVGLVLGVLCLIALLITFRYTKSKYKIVPTVEFSEPKDTNSAEVGYLIDATVENRDITSLIIYWASKGYIKIEEKGKKITLERLKPADDEMKKYEQKFFNKIFATGERVQLDDLGGNFGEAVRDCKYGVRAGHKYKSFNQKAMTSLWYFAILPIILMALALIFTQMRIGSTYIYAISFVLLFGVSMAMLWLVSIKKHQYYLGKKFAIRRNIAFVLITAFLVAINILQWDFYCDPFCTKILASILILVGGILICLQSFHTKKGAILAGQLIGLKNYIEVAEKDRIVLLAEKEPEVFYKILPFAYVLGVSKIWCEKFESIHINAPSWYVTDSGDMFSTIVFYSMFNNSLNSINTTFTASSVHTTASQFGGPFGSGGGFSGGGFGGGGGGSW